MYCSIGGRYERASVSECEIVTSRSRFPFASFLSVVDNRTTIRCPTNIGPLVADFVFNHATCNRFRFEIHDSALVPPAGYVYDLDLIPRRPPQRGHSLSSQTVVRRHAPSRRPREHDYLFKRR